MKLKKIFSSSLSVDLRSLSYPILISFMLNNLYSIIDLAFVGQLGKIPTAAISIASIVQMVIMGIMLGIANAHSILCSNYYAKKDIKSINIVNNQSFLLAFCMGLLTSALVLLFGKYMIIFMGGKGEVLKSALIYIEIVSSGNCFLFLFITLNSFFRSTGKAKSPVQALLIANIFNLVLDPIFIFGYFGFPRLGIKGSAITTLFTPFFGFFYMLALFRKHPLFPKLKLNLKPNFTMLKRISSLGFFNSLQLFIRNIDQILLTKFAAFYGNTAIATLGVVMRIRMALLMPGFAIAQSTSILVSKESGHKNIKRAHFTGNFAYLHYAIFMSIASILSIIFAKQITSLFNSNPEVLKEAAKFLRIFSVCFIFTATGIIYQRIFMGFQNTKAPLIITSVALGIRMPLAFITALYLPLQYYWWAVTLGNTLEGILSFFAYRVFARNHFKEE